jgi:hypothetical protein
VPHVGSALRVDEERDRGRLLVLVELGQRAYLRERIAVETEPQSHCLLGQGQQVLRERIAGLDDDQTLQVLLGHDHLARELVGIRLARLR